MKYLIPGLMILVAMSCSDPSGFTYPETRKGTVADTYHGTEIADPYRWLEDDRSEETEAWVEAQNEVTFSHLESIPFRDQLRERMTTLWNYPKMGTPRKEGDLFFYSFNSGLQNQSVIHLTEDLNEEGKVFLDPNQLSEDGTVALSTYSVSNDQKYFGYGVSKGGSDWQEFFIRDIRTGKDLADHLKWIKFSGISWFRDGFFYSRYEQPEKGSELTGENRNSKVYYHRAGTGQSEDILIYSDGAHPDWMFRTAVTEDEKYMFLSVTESTSGNALAFRKAGTGQEPFIWLDRDFDNDHIPVGNDGSILYLLTNLDAPRYRLVAIDLENPDSEAWKEVIPEHEIQVLESASLLGGKIVATYLKDAYHIVRVFDLEGTPVHEVALPGIGSVGGFSGKMKNDIAFFSFSSFNYPPSVFRYHINQNLVELHFSPDVDFDADNYETKQVFYTSKDGTRVPMFIVHRKGIELNGDHPALLYGYGGFNVSLTPSFSTTRAIWLEQGGVFALANIRGGGEYGEKWHKSGTLLRKQNVFDDFIAAAEYLISEDYTSSERLAIYGGSNGGLLIGAVINQRPDLFAAAVPMVGVMDMLRFHKFTIGRFWTVDYGSSDDPEQFEYLLNYSPLHNISTDKDYPAVLVTTGDHDDRVVPAHSFKYIATLQEKYKGENPVMIRINTDAGHGAGKPTDKVIAEYSDIWSFLFYHTGFAPEFP